MVLESTHWGSLVLASLLSAPLAQFSGPPSYNPTPSRPSLGPSIPRSPTPRSPTPDRPQPTVPSPKIPNSTSSRPTFPGSQTPPDGTSDPFVAPSRPGSPYSGGSSPRLPAAESNRSGTSRSSKKAPPVSLMIFVAGIVGVTTAYPRRGGFMSETESGLRNAGLVAGAAAISFGGLGLLGIGAF